MTYISLHNVAQLGLHVMGPSWAISSYSALGLNHPFCRSIWPDEKDPLAEILPAPSIILQMDQLSRGLSSQQEPTSADFYHHDSKPIPAPNSNDSIPAQNIGQTRDERDDWFGRFCPHLLYRVQFAHSSYTFLIMFAQPLGGINEASSPIICGQEESTPAFFFFPRCALA